MKKFILSLFVGLFGIISFCSAINFDNNSNSSYVLVPKSSSITTGLSIPANTIKLMRINSSSINCSIDNNSVLTTNTLNIYSYINSSNSSVSFTVSCSNSNSTNNSYIYFYDLSLVNICPSFPICTGYNLNVVIPGVMNDTYNINSDVNLYLGDNVSSSTISYPNIYVSSTCQDSSECPDGDFSGFSNFYVRHGESTWSQLTGTENYYLYLPEYLGYNFEYSNGTDLDFTVGVATDTGFINNINAVQNSKPSQEDLNRLISEIIPLFVPGLAVILLLYFIFRFIKKVF